MTGDQVWSAGFSRILAVEAAPHLSPLPIRWGEGVFPSVAENSLFGECADARFVFSLSPSHGERAGVRGILNCNDTAKAGTPCLETAGRTGQVRIIINAW